jgi:hypothetical protein
MPFFASEVCPPAVSTVACFVDCVNECTVAASADTISSVEVSIHKLLVP